MAGLNQGPRLSRLGGLGEATFHAVSPPGPAPEQVQTGQIFEEGFQFGPMVPDLGRQFLEQLEDLGPPCRLVLGQTVVFLYQLVRLDEKRLPKRIRIRRS